MLLVTYNEALQSKPAKCEQLRLTPDDNIHHITKINDREYLYFKQSRLEKTFKNKYPSF